MIRVENKQVNKWRYASVSGTDATETGQTLVDITGLSLALAANTVYEFEAVLMCLTSADTTGTAYGVNFSGAGASVEAGIIGAFSATAAKALRISALNTSTGNMMAGSGQTGTMTIKGRLTVGANAGDLTIMHRKITSGTSTVYIGSFLKVRVLA